MSLLMIARRRTEIRRHSNEGAVSADYILPIEFSKPPGGCVCPERWPGATRSELKHRYGDALRHGVGACRAHVVGRFDGAVSEMSIIRRRLIRRAG